MEFTVLPYHVNFVLVSFLDKNTFTRLPLSAKDLIYFNDNIDYELLSKQFIEPDALPLCLIQPKFNILTWLLNGYPKTVDMLKKVENYLFSNRQSLAKNKIFVKLYYRTTLFAENFDNCLVWNTWLKVVKPSKTTIQLILRHIDQMDQRIIASRKLVPWDILLQHSGKFDFKYFHTTDVKILAKLKFHVNWTAIIRNLSIDNWSVSFIEDNIEFIDLNELAYKKSFPMSFIERHLEKFDFDVLCKTQNLSIDFIKKYSNCLTNHNLYLLQKNKYFNKPDTIQITKAKDSWFIIELPYTAVVKGVNFCSLDQANEFARLNP